MGKIIISLLFLLSIIVNLSAQKDNITFNQQEREVSIDFQNLFKSSSLGANLVYKKRIGITDSISLEKTRVMRFRIGGFVDANINDKETVETQFENITEGNGIIESENNELPNNHFAVFVLTGIEWQHQRKRLQYYGGFETGYKIEKEKDITDADYLGNELIRTKEINNREHSVLLNGIGGCKFFLSPNFSVGVETSIESSFNIIRNTTISDDRLIESKRIVTTKNNQLFASFDYLNGLFLSYYF